MERKKNQAIRWAVILGFFYLVGFIGFSIEELTPYFIRLVPFSLLLTAFVLFSFHTKTSPTYILYALLTMLIGFTVEWIGVHTGLLFGHYGYGETLGFKIGDIPLLIGLNWLLLNYCSCCIASRVAESLPVRALVAALLMLFVDMLMEPVAIRFDYWHWENGHIPLRNYTDWLLLSYALSLIFFMLNIDGNNRVARYVYIIMLLFFIGLNLY